MRMNHINLAVSDVPASRGFFETYFGLKCIAESDRDKLVVLVDDAQCFVTLSNFASVDEVSYPKSFHVGFFQPSREKVDEIFERLEADGLNPKTRREFHGAWTFYLRAPGGFTVEVGHQYETPNLGAAGY